MAINSSKNNSSIDSSVSDAGTISGFDVSTDQGNIDFIKVKNAGKTFVFIKATEGITYQDPTYIQNISTARAAGLAVGSYHFYRTNDAPLDQFENFSTHADILPGDLPPVIDIEEFTDNKINTNLIAELTQFINSIDEKYGIQPILYSNESFANSYLEELSQYPLWLAEYTNAATPTLPKKWNQWTFWQYSETGRIDGVVDNVDLNRFNGNSEEFATLLIK